jgi:NADH:ubiquinone oxidoreductase subunit 3 (subunit A)
MADMSEYLGLVIFFVMSATLAGAFIFLASVLGPKKPSLV